MLLKRIKKFFAGFVYAGRGIVHAISTQRNMRVHIAVAVLTAILAKAARVGRLGFAAIFICFGLVIALEMVNTALEEFVNGVYPEYNETAKVVKDVAAGAVLVAAIASVCVAVVLMTQPGCVENLAERFRTVRFNLLLLGKVTIVAAFAFGWD